MKRQRKIVGEWFFRITGTAQARPSRVRVLVENADRRDLRFVQALARVIEVWITLRRGRAA